MTVTPAEPFGMQLALFTMTLAVGAPNRTILTVPVTVHPLLSVTVTVKIPPVSPVAVCVVCIGLVLQE